MNKKYKVLIIVLAIILTFKIVPPIVKTVKLRNSITEYTVVDKQYHKAYTTTSFMYINKHMIPTTQYHPQSWVLKCNGVDLEGNIRKFSFDFDETIYHEIDVNDIINKELINESNS